MTLRCGGCRAALTEDEARLDACPHCGDDGYSDWAAHQPTPRRERPVPDDDGPSDLREWARELAR